MKSQSVKRRRLGEARLLLASLIRFVLGFMTQIKEKQTIFFKLFKVKQEVPLTSCVMSSQLLYSVTTLSIGDLQIGQCFGAGRASQH